MALKQITGHITLNLFLVIIVFQLQSQQCDALPVWADIGWKTMGAGSALADTLKERVRDGDGAVNSIDATNKFFRRFSKFGAAAGSIFALAGTFFSIFDDSDGRKHKELLAEFSNVKNGMRNINSKMDKIIKVIKHEHAKTKGFESFALIEGAARILDNYNKHPEQYKADLMRYLQNNDMYNALNMVFKLVNDGDSIVKAYYEKTHGNLGEINNLRAYVNALIYTGSAVQTTICMLNEVDKRGKSAKQAKHTCYDIKGDDFEQLERDLNDKFDTWEAKAKHDYKENIQNFVDEEYDSNDFNQDNKALAVSIRDKLKSSYAWVDLMVGVYNPISGWDNHAIDTQAHAFRDKNGKKNWLVMANDKKNTSSRTITRSSLKYIVENAEYKIYNKKICSNPGRDGICQNVMLRNYYDDARSYLRSLKTDLEARGVHWFGLAVIRRNEGLSEAWLPLNKFFFFNSKHFTVLGGIKGRIFENSQDICTDFHCTNGGTCNLKKQGKHDLRRETASCNCQLGYSGKKCEDPTFMKESNKYCNKPYATNINNINKAKSECWKNIECIAIGSKSCKDSGYYLCKEEKEIKVSAKGSCIHRKKGDGYEMRANAWCSPKRDKTYPTVSEAERQCSDDPSCTMFYDSKGEGTKFYLCDDGAKIKKSAKGSNLHIKKFEELWRRIPNADVLCSEDDNSFEVRIDRNGIGSDCNALCNSEELQCLDGWGDHDNTRCATAEEITSFGCEKGSHATFICSCKKRDGYDMRVNAWCSPKRDKTYPTVSEAKRQCSDDPSCTMFYDSEGEGTKFCLCDDGAKIKKSKKGSILYRKCKDDPDWTDDKYGDGKAMCTDIVHGDCELDDDYSIEAKNFCPLACGVCTV